MDDHQAALLADELLARLVSSQRLAGLEAPGRGGRAVYRPAIWLPPLTPLCGLCRATAISALPMTMSTAFMRPGTGHCLRNSSTAMTAPIAMTVPSIE